MASWFGTLAGNVESLLDRVDQVANQTFIKDDDGLPTYFDEEGNVLPPESQMPRGSSTNAVKSSHLTITADLSHATPRADGEAQNSWTVRQKLADIGSLTPYNLTKSKLTTTKDPDQELFEFLNNADIADPTGTVVARRESRSPSASSSISARSRKTPEGSVSSTVEAVQATAIPVSHEIIRITTSDENVGNSTQLSKTQAPRSRSISEAEQENDLLNNEITSLNRELHLHVQRFQSTQQELTRTVRQLEALKAQQVQSEQIAGELRRRDADCREALAAKDAQIAVLRTRLEEADLEISAQKRHLNELQSAGDRIHQDQQSSTAFVQRHLLDSLQEKLNDSETARRHEHDEHRREIEEGIRRQSRLEAEKQNLVEEIASLQKNLNREKAKNAEFSAQLKAAHAQAEAAKQELSDYRDKATRILQSKEKLIASLKEGLSTGKGDDTNLTVLMSELDSSKHEKEVLRDQLQNAHIALDSLRRELAELEAQAQNEAESAAEQVSTMEEQYRGEKRRREDVEFDLNKQKQELRLMHDELVKQKAAFQSRLQSRDDEIDRLRSQLVTKSMNASNQEELESRLKALTESLIQKQTILESLSTEKNSLILQLERMEKHCREAESSALRAASVNVNVAEDDEVRQRMPGFMKQSPLDNNVTRRVKMAAGVLDKLGLQLGLFLRRYPIARVFVIMYAVLLHLWVMLVLLTYQQEMHSDEHQLLPHAPQAP